MPKSFDARVHYSSYVQTVKLRVESMRESVGELPEVNALAYAVFSARISAGSAVKTAATAMRALQRTGQLFGFMSKYAGLKSRVGLTAHDFLQEDNLQLLRNFNNALHSHGKDPLNEDLISAKVASLKSKDAAAKIAWSLRELLALQFGLSIVRPTSPSPTNIVGTNRVIVNAEFNVIMERVIIEEVESDMKKINFQTLLIDLQKEYRDSELQKQPTDRELNPRALPIVREICDEIANLFIEQPLIAIVDASHFGPGGKAQGTSSRAAVFFTNKGVPLGIHVVSNLKGYAAIAELEAMLLGVNSVQEFSPNMEPCYIISDNKQGVLDVRSEIAKIKAGRASTNINAGLACKIAVDAVKQQSTLEFGTGHVIDLADFLSHVCGKLGKRLLHHF